MVLKIGIEQIPRKLWEWVQWDENWISANYVNNGEPDQTHKIPKSEKKFNYGFNDFIMVECTPELAYQVTGVWSKNAELPPEHPRAWRDRSDLESIGMQGFWKHRSGYKTMAYGWGTHSDVLDSSCTTNQYCDIEGPNSDNMHDEAFVKLIPLLIPGGLAKNDTFWIDLNKGVRALYFPARYQYSDDFPEDAAYAKISFVEEGARNLIDAEPLIFGNTLSKALFDSAIDLIDINRKTFDTIVLDKKHHVGAYSFDSTIIVNVPAFIEASYWVSINDSSKAKPHDAVYLAKSTSIKAKRLPFSDSYEHWRMPPEYYNWGLHTKPLMHSYAGDIGRQDQLNLQEASTSKVSGEAELFLNIILFAASLIPYVGPLVSTLGGQVLENMTDLRTDSSDQEASAAGISAQVWNGIPGEAKEKAVQRLSKTAISLLKTMRR